MFKDVSSVDERSARQVDQCLFSGPADISGDEQRVQHRLRLPGMNFAELYF